MVTVIIPTYRRADSIERAINSVLNQTYKDYEIIVVDDNNPNTIERKELENKMLKYNSNKNIIYIQHEKNKNGAAARNTGIKIAKGEYITFLDDDDYFLPERLEKMVQALNNNTEYNAAYSSSLIVENSKIINKIIANKSGNFQKELLMQKSFFGTGSNLFFRAESLKELNGFNEKFIRHQDIEVMLRFFEKNKILAVEDILVIKNTDNKMNVPNIDKFLNVKKLFFETFEKEINKLTGIEKKEVYYLNYKEIFILCIKSKQYSKAKEVLKMMQQYKKVTIKEKLIFIWILINAYIKFIKIKKYFISKKHYKNLNEEIIREINKNETISK